MQSRTAVPQSLKVIKKLLESLGFQTSSSSQDQIDYAVVSKHLEKLHGQYSILTLVLHDIVQYSAEAAKDYEESKEGAMVKQINKR